MDASFDWVIDCFRSELQKEDPDIARLSITLGLLERSYTAKEQLDNLNIESLQVRLTAENAGCIHEIDMYSTPSPILDMLYTLQEEISACEETFQGFVDDVGTRISAETALDARVMPTTLASVY